MAAVRLSKPPRLPAHAHYSLYRDWLLNNFYDHLCSYCLLQHESLEIEHVEPVQYAPNRKNDPSNLLLACRRCNGGKSDYHPLLGSRRTRTQDRTGFSVLDVRRDDFTDLYEITQDGRLQPKPGQHYERAIWNVLLLKLDIKFVADKRAECLRILHACEGLIGKGGDKSEDLLKVLVPLCAKQGLLLHVFGISVSAALQSRLAEYTERHRPNLQL